MDIVQMQSVASSQIKEIGYDPETQKLRVCFLDKRGGDGSIYEYSGVEQGVYDALMSAESVGRTFAASVKWSYPYQKIG